MYIEREIKDKFTKLLKVYPIIAIVGARQSGKTTFLKEQIKALNTSYLSFDDPDVRALFDSDIKKFENQFIMGKEFTVLDEVQYCKDPGIKLKYLADKGEKILLTSSSEILLSKDVLSYLVGRVSILRLYPFSIHEFFNAKAQKELTENILERHIWEHITYGGYPKVVIIEDIELKKTILKDLYETMILKDITKTFSLGDIQSLEEFAKYLSINIGNLLSYENITKNIRLSFQTIKKYINAMEKSYLIARVPPFYTNKNKEITKQPKIYFIDTGLRNIITNNFALQLEGKLFENYVYLELIKLGFYPKYWRTKAKAEIDFIIEKDNEIIPIEVKLHANPEKIERNLRSFILSYKPKKALIISYKTLGKKLKLNNCLIHFINVHKLKDILTK